MSELPARSRLTWIPIAIALAVFGLYFVVMLAYARTLLLFPFDYDQGEGFELYDAIRLARGQNIYLNNAQFPFYSSNYPPVYRVLLVPLIWLFGPQIWVGRAVAFVCTLAIGGLIMLAARKLWRPANGAGRWIDRAVAVLAGLAFFAANYIYHVAPLARAHLPMLMFAVAGLLCIDRGLRHSDARGQARWTALGIALLMTAGFTKLQAVDALVAGFAFLLIRRPRWCLQALVGCLVATVVIVLWLNTASEGQFWLNVISANVNEYDFAVTAKTYTQWFQLQGVLIVCATLFVIGDAGAVLRARSFQPISIWSLYFVTGSALGLLTGKWGAGPTYLAAAIAASCVCTVGLLNRVAGWWQANGRPQSPIYALVAVVFLAQAALNVHLPTSGRFFGALARVLGLDKAPSSYPPYPYYDSSGYTQLGHLLDRADTANGWALVEELKKHPGPVWSEEAMLTLHAGKDVVTNPTQLLNLSKNGALDTRDMIARIEQREFGAVVFRAYFYPDDVKQAIDRNYATVGSIKINGFDYYLLLPR